MPTERFFHLKEGKKQAILEAAGDELLETPYSLLTVSRIIRRAGISRASFYYYFSDKEDLFHHLIEEVNHRFITEIQTALEEKKGNFCEGFKRAVSHMLEDQVLEKSCRLYRRLVDDTECHSQALRQQAAFYESSRLKAMAEECQELLDSEAYPGLDQEKLGCLMELGVLVVVKTLFLYFAGSEKKEYLEGIAGCQLEILDRGARALPREGREKRCTA